MKKSIESLQEELVRTAKLIVEAYEKNDCSALCEILSDSDYIDPLRFNVRFYSRNGTVPDTEYLKEVVFDRCNVDVLVDNSDGTYTLCIPGVKDYLQIMQRWLDEASRDGNKLNVRRI